MGIIRRVRALALERDCQAGVLFCPISYLLTLGKLCNLFLPQLSDLKNDNAINSSKLYIFMNVKLVHVYKSFL